jgi:hypothetical protein
MHSSSTSRRALLGALVVLVPLASSGCLKKQGVERRYYENHIQPILTATCVGNTSPCHRANDQGIALGNLDLSSYDNVQKRRDVLRTYGSYTQPLILMKALPEAAVQIPFRGKTYLSEIRHTGGKTLSPNSDAFFELKHWLDNGANRDGILPVGKPNSGLGGCNSSLPPGWTPPTGVDTQSSAYTTFQSTVFPMLKDSCAYSTCHSSPQSDFYLTCGGSPETDLFNFLQAASFVISCDGTTPWKKCDDATMPSWPSVDQSEILLRPLSVPGGGINHTGGVFFQTRMDRTWQGWETWAKDVQQHPPLLEEKKSVGRVFFEENVLPKMVQRGCALEGCHSPDGFNDFRLRPGAQGFLSAGALTRDYETTLLEFMALDSIDVRQSRAVKKATVGGITHRGGALLEDEGVAAGTPCPATFPSPYDPTATYSATNPASARAVCVIQEWHRLERIDRAASVSTMAMGETVPLAFVARPPNDDNLLQFDTYRGGADLKLADATMGAGGQVASVGNVRSALTSCAGLAGKDVDVRGPEWSYDGTKVIFAARPGAASGFDLWQLDVAGGMACKQLTADNGRAVNGVRVHNFDPVYAPDGSVVFASTRAGTVTLKNFLPNSDLFRVLAPALDFGNPQQMTFLLNSELSPAFMQDGRVTMTTEKATPDLYQLAGRRMNWDLTDYHPLLAQRAQSTNTFTTDEHPSVGYQQATEIREGLDRNFLLVLSDAGAKGGGGALATFNRSIGPFEADRDEVTFLKSLVIVDPAATAHADTKGAYRSPYSLPNGEILASYAANVTDPSVETPKYDLVAVAIDGAGTRRPLASDPALSYVEAALGYKRAGRILFDNLPQLVFGGHNDAGGGGAATMHFPDLPLLATLLGANLRHGRNVEEFDKATRLQAFTEAPPPVGTTPANPPPGLVNGVYSQRTSLGTAPLAADKSLIVSVPSGKPLIFQLVDNDGNAVFTMTESHQVTNGEYITPGAPRAFFNNICGGCHGSISGNELEVSVTADVLTGASVSMSRGGTPISFQ